jgi:hypothetical protein
MEKGSIYQAKSKTSGKSYVGQTQDLKNREGKPYKYGLAGRWSDHVSSAFRGAKTPLATAILEHGAEDFELICLEAGVNTCRLDEREAHWMTAIGSVVPAGYNVMRHARCKHRVDTTLAQHYLATTAKIRISPIKQKGEYKLVYVILEQKDAADVRLVFGQGEDATFQEAVEEAEEFATVFALEGIDVDQEQPDDPLRKYRAVIISYRGKTVERLRLAKFNSLVALHIKTSETTRRMCFGGKTICLGDAYKTAMAVKNALEKECNVEVFINDLSESATGDCVSR